MKSDAVRGEVALFRTQSQYSELRKRNNLTKFGETYKLEEESREHLSAT